MTADVDLQLGRCVRLNYLNISWHWMGFLSTWASSMPALDFDFAAPAALAASASSSSSQFLLRLSSSPIWLTHMQNDKVIVRTHTHTDTDRDWLAESLCLIKRRHSVSNIHLLAACLVACLYVGLSAELTLAKSDLGH